MQLPSLDRNVEAFAHGVERGRRARPVLARQHERVDEPILRQLRPAEELKLVVEEIPIEFGVVSDNRRIAEEFHQSVDDVGVAEIRLAAQCFIGDAGDADGCFRNGPARIDVDLKFAARRQVVDQLDAADLYDPVPLSGVEAGGFGIEDDFPHVSVPLAARRRERRAARTASTCASA